ncbi:uncharacterized protein LOC132193522 [Neocloeon triangulifer]|uniref:uncharacterized protein LOC132193522 n=1 Tax=Neocloeon triangulifer TaxID=2078957 RepID=UPI00286F5BDF|nr:uncharacterized protein LOC132193522 [Neocloeon triangulifer]
MSRFILCLTILIFNSQNLANAQTWKLVSRVVTAAVNQEDFDGYEFNGDTVYAGENLITDFDFTDTFSLELWSMACYRLNISVKFVAQPSVAEVSQLVYQGGANLAMVSTVFGPEETKGLVITQPTHSTTYKLFVQSPTSVSTSLSLGKVFAPVLWLAIVISMLMMGVILIFIEFVGQKAKIRSYLATPADIGQLIIIVIGCFCYQGAIQIASGCSGRVLVWTSLICGYLIYVTFNTEVISQLTTVAFKPPFESLSDMAAKGTHKLIVRNDTSLLDNIKVTRLKDGKRGPLADIWDALLPIKPKAENLYNNKSDIKRMCLEKVAFLDSELAIPPKDQQTFRCNVMKLKDSYFRSNVGFVLNVNNTFNQQIIKVFNRMRETGIINRMRRYIDQPDVGPLKPLPDLNPIDIATLIPMLIVLYVGMAASLITLGLEIAFKHGGGELIRRMNERGFYTWKDVICFWKVRKPNPDEEESSSDEDSDTDVEQPPQQKTAPTIKISTTPQQPIKVRSTNEKPNSLNKYPVKAAPIAILGQNDDKKSNLINKNKLVPPEFRLNDGKDFEKLRNYINENQNRPRPLRRQNRVSDLTNIFPKQASLNQQYLDKNTIRDHDSSQESNNFESPRPDRRSPAPVANRELKPDRLPVEKPQAHANIATGQDPIQEKNNLTSPKNNKESGASAKSPAVNRELKPNRSPGREPLAYANIGHDKIQRKSEFDIPKSDKPTVNRELKPGRSPGRERKSANDPALPVRRVGFLTPDSPKDPISVKSVPNSPKYNPEDLAKPKKQSREELLKKQTAPEPLQVPQRRESRPRTEGQERNRVEIPPAEETADLLFPLNINQIPASRQNPAPPNLNLHLSIDTDGFLDRHSIIDMNLARRMRQNRDPDPFGGPN